MNRGVILLAGLFALWQSSFAQPSARPVRSLEVLTDESPVIFVGRVTDIKSTTDSGPLSTVVVEELIRGDAAKEIYQINLWKPIDELADLKRRKVRLLIFLRDEGDGVSGTFEVDDPEIKAPLAYFTFLKGGAAILKLAKERARLRPEPTAASFHIGIHDSEARSQWMQELVDAGETGTMISGLLVPIDARLEKWARSALESGDLYVAGNAINALGHFKSPENINLLKKQLQSKLFSPSADGENIGYEKRQYGMRHRAYEILTNWGVAVEPPIFEEVVPVFDSMKELYWQGPVTPERLQVILKFKNLTNLQFHAPKLGLSEIRLISKVQSLTHLGLTNSGVTDDDLFPLASLPHLTKLELGGLNVTDEGLKQIAKIKSLRELWVAGTEVTKSGLDWLAKERPDIKVGGSDQLNAALRFAMQNDLEGLKRMAARDPKSLKITDFYDNTPLHIAAQFGAYDAAVYLIEQGADVNAINKSGMNALVQAASKYNPNGDLMRLLVNRGVDVDRPDSNGWTALRHLIITGTPYQVRYILNSGGDPSRFDPAWVETLRSGKPEIDRLLQEYKDQRERIPELLGQVKGECRNEVYNLKTGSTDRLTTTGHGPFTGDLVWSETPKKRPYLGPLGQQKVSLQLGDLPDHQLVTVELEVFLIGSWDGNGDGEGPDILHIEVPGLGSLLYSTFYNNGTKGARLQSFPNVYRQGFHEGYTGALEAETLAFPDDVRSSVYRFSFTFAHTGPDFLLDVKGLTVPQGGLGGLLYDERWGITNLKVKTD